MFGSDFVRIARVHPDLRPGGRGEPLACGPGVPRLAQAVERELRGRVNKPLTPNCPELFEMRVRNLPSIPRGAPTPELVVSSLLAMGQAAIARAAN